MSDLPIRGGEVLVGDMVIQDISFPEDTAEAIGARALSCDDSSIFTADSMAEEEPDDALDDETERLQRQADDFAVRHIANAQTRSARGLRSRYPRLLRRPPRLPRAAVRYQQFLPDPRYDAMLDRITVNGQHDIDEDESAGNIWGTQMESVVEKGRPVSNHLLADGPESGDSESDFSSRNSSFLTKLGERMRRHQLALGFGAMILAGSVMFVATSVGGNEPARNPIAKSERQLTPLKTDTANIFSMPTEVSTPVRIPQPSAAAVTESPIIETSLTPPSENTEVTTAVVTPGGNLPWAIKEQLIILGINNPHTLDVVADTLTEEMQAGTDRDLGKVYAGDSFDISTRHIRELLGLDLKD